MSRDLSSQQFDLTDYAWDGDISGLVIRRGTYAPDYSTWRSFVEGRAKMPNIDTLILDSWRRCVQMGVDPASDIQSEPSPNAEFEKDVLLELADRLNPSIKHLMVQHNLVFAVTDSQGRFVYRDGHPQALMKTETLGFVLNADWSEKSVGTNAVGTCLSVGFPLQVFGREHFRASHHNFRCTAAPFFSPSGQIIGCVDLSSQLDVDHSKNLELVIGVSRFFERVLLKTHAKEMRAWPMTLLGEIDQSQGGLVVVDVDGCVCGADLRAQAILGPRAHALNGRPASEIFDLSPLRLPPHNRCHLEEKNQVVKSLKTPTVIAEAKRLWSPSGLWLGLLLRLFDPDLAKSSMSQAVRLAAKVAAPARIEWDFLGDSAVSREMRLKAQAYAQTSSTVLITGESGTGKERLARSIHALGPRWSAPFVAVNCGALTETLVQSELFGYAPGAFTGADRKGRAGVFEQANGGVLFLDEIGDLPLRQQVNLLRVLEEKAVTRVGGSESVAVNVKVVAATNRDLAFELNQGRFREDLFHRLGVMVINLPPLRQRPDDILPIARFHLGRLAREVGLPQVRLSPRVEELFFKLPWPGNVRSLINALEYACNQYFLAPFETVEPEHLPPNLASAAGGKPLMTLEENEGEDLLAAAEKRTLLKALGDNGSNITKAAKSLGIARNTLYAKMKRHAIPRP